MTQDNNSGLRGKIDQALKDAIRSGDDLRKRTLRMVVSAIRQVEIDSKGQPDRPGAKLDDAGVIAVLQKELKSRQEAISDAQRAQRPDLIQEYQSEVAVIQEFLPEAFTTEELECLAKQVIVEVGAVDIKEMGKVMKTLMPRLAGRATGDQASLVVRRLLQSGIG